MKKTKLVFCLVSVFLLFTIVTTNINAVEVKYNIGEEELISINECSVFFGFINGTNSRYNDIKIELLQCGIIKYEATSGTNEMGEIGYFEINDIQAGCYHVRLSKPSYIVKVNIKDIPQLFLMFPKDAGLHIYNISIKRVYSKDKVIEDSNNIITVDNEGDGDFTKIYDAVKAADPGDTIEVYSGIYYENVIVYKQLILKGIAKELGIGNDIGKPIVDSKGFGSLDSSNCSIILKTDRCIVENFTLINSGAFHGAGIKIYSSYNIIKNNFISNNWNGIYPVDESSFNFIYNNEIKDNDLFGVKCGGLFDDNCSDNNITNNIISSNMAGIAVAPRDIVYNNTIFKNRQGIILESRNVKVIKNTIYDNEIGVFVHDINLIVKNNIISNNDVGIYLHYCKGSIAIYNNLTKNDIGIRVYDAKYCTINYNNFFNNTIQAIFIYSQKPKNTNWNKNYWSDWKTTTPRLIEGKIIIDHWPVKYIEYYWIQYDISPLIDPIEENKVKIKIKL